MSDPNVLTQDDDIDVIGLFAALKRKWWLVLLVTVLATVGLFLFLSAIPERYESNARIIIENKDNAFNRTLNDNGGQQTNNQFDEEAIRSQVEVISSDKIALEIMTQLDLENSDEFNEKGFFDAIGDMFAGDDKPQVAPNNSNVISSSQSAVLDEFKKRLKVYPIEKSRAIVIEFWSTDPNIALEVPNRIAQEYVKIQEEKKKKLTQDAKVWLNPVVNEYRQKLEEAEADVAAFRAKQDILRSGTTNQSLATQQLSEISTELSRLRAERSSAQAKVASIRAALKSGASLDAIPEVIASPLIQRLREREAEIKAQISDLSTTLLPNHPRLKSLNSQIDDFQRQIRGSANNILKSLENNVNLTRETEADLMKEIDRLKEEVTRVNKQEVKLDALVRKADSYRDLLSEYEKRNLEALSRSNFTPIDAEVYPSRSMPVEPYFPKVVPFTIAGGVASMLLTILGILAVTLLSSIGNARQSQTAQVAQEPAMEEVPAEHTQAAIVDDSDFEQEDKPARSNPFAQLENIIAGKTKNRLSKQADESPEVVKTQSPLTMPKVAAEPKEKAGAIAVRYAASVFQDLGEGRIVVASPGGDRGSKTAWILARQLGRNGENGVVIIDLSGGGATAHEMLGGNELPGIFNLISGAVSVNNIIYRDQKSGVHVVPSGTLFQGEPMPDMQTMSDVIDAIALSYDYCIIDCGDADLDGINLVATDDAIVIISGVNARIDDCKSLEADLKDDGFKDILHIIPDEIDQKRNPVAEPA
jgi:uncharacterized protein involved in exopolysaccharide biosynthesis/Mrp family chromosome partitioning ATPase